MEGYLYLSIHPLDYLSISETNHGWRSCHALDGEYRNGNLSYLTIRFNDPNNGNAWGDWKTIAFTDSIVAAAYALANPSTNGAALTVNSNGSINTGFGYGFANDYINYGIYTVQTGGSPKVALAGYGGLEFKTDGKTAMTITNERKVAVGDAFIDDYVFDAFLV